MCNLPFRPTRLFRFLALVCWLFTAVGSVSAQLLPPNQPEQDCINAIPVCQNVYFTPASYQGEGLNPNEINSNLSCLGLGEENDCWYIFSIQQSGNLAFTISPVNPLDDYDWAVYNLTTASCSDIATNGALEVSCNYSGTLGITGANGLGPCGFDPNCPTIPVTMGQTYVLNVSNWNTPLAGYTLNFGASTAVIFDTTSTRIDTLVTTCGTGNIFIEFSEDLLCNSVQPTDFTVNGPGGPYVVTAVSGVNCAAGGGYEDDFQIITTPAITTGGTFYISLVDTVLDRCDNVTTSGLDSLLIDIPPLLAQAMPDTLCPGDSSQLSTGLGPLAGGYQIYWQSGTLSGNSPFVNPASTASYTVSIVDTLTNCVFHDTVTVTVRGLPTSTFSVSAPTVCDADSLVFSYTGSAPPNAAYLWSFGNGASGSGANAQIQHVSWPDTGQKQICLTVTDQGCVSPVTCNSIGVIASPDVSVTPVIGQCLGNNAFSFQATASIDVTTFAWNLGDGTLSGVPGPTHTYNTPGIYPVQLIVTNAAGCQDTATTTVSVFSPVTADYSASNVCIGESIQFTDNSVFAVGEPIISWNWTFGDGATATDPNPTRNYGFPGTYTVTLAVETAPGCRDTISKQIEVYPRPAASFTGTPACEQTHAVSFINTSFFTNSTEIYAWSFGDGSLAAMKDVSHVYSSAGFYPVTLIATNGFGCADTVVNQIEVYPRPNMAFDGEDVCMNDSTVFSNQCTLPPGYQFAGFQWDFGNGTRSTAQNPKAFYPRPDIYNVRLIASTRNGCRDTLSKEIRVFANPEPGFEAEAVCQGDSMLFFDQSTMPLNATGDVLSAWQYDFGDGSTGSGQNPFHIYQQDGFFTVIQTVTSDKGCAVRDTQEVEVYSIPSGPVVVHDSVCLGETAKLRVLPDSITRRVYWYKNQTDETPFWELPLYEIPELETRQTFYVKAVSVRGCEGSRKRIRAYPYPVFNGSIHPLDSTLELPEAIVPFSIQSSMGYHQVNWTFGDGVLADTANPVHRYIHGGLYNVEAEILDNHGCVTELNARIEVKKVFRAILANAFTPNNDGINDTWELVSNNVLEATVSVYDRYGALLFYGGSMDFEWDGKSLSGKGVPEGVYVYMLRGIDIEGSSFEQSGTVTLIR